MARKAVWKGMCTVDVNNYKSLWHFSKFLQTSALRISLYVLRPRRSWLDWRVAFTVPYTTMTST